MPAGNGDKDGASARTDVPIPPACGIYYYEVEIRAKENKRRVSTSYIRLFSHSFILPVTSASGRYCLVKEAWSSLASNVTLALLVQRSNSIVSQGMDYRPGVIMGGTASHSHSLRSETGARTRKLMEVCRHYLAEYSKLTGNLRWGYSRLWY